MSTHTRAHVMEPNRKLLLLLGGALGAGVLASGGWRYLFHVFGIRTEEEAAYRVRDKEGPFEIRDYRPHLVAETQATGEFFRASRTAFRRLANFIFGEKMAMTAPVESEMTTTGWKMSFVLPSQYALETAPQPADHRIALTRIPARTVASLRFSGAGSDAAFLRKTEELFEWLAKKRIAILGRPRFAQYDPPFALPFLRRNEVLVEVEHAGPQFNEGA